jgi:thiol-disulfide isomerase/thioredoxin
MKNGLTIFSSLALIFGLFTAGAAQAATVPVPEKAPINVLVFWGSWCPNCPAVMKEMDKVRAQFAGHKVRFVAVSFAGESNPQQALQKKGVSFDVMTDGDDLFKQVGGVGVPWVVVTDDKGQVIAKPSAHNVPASVPGDVAMELNLRGI